MNPAFFQAQIQRLITRFTARNFDQEFCKLVWAEVRDMSEENFRRFVDVLIGSRTANRPPLLTEFREARQLEQKRSFDNDVRGASYFLSRKSPEETRNHLRLILSKDFGAVDSVSEALAVATIKRRVNGNNDDGQEGA